MGSPLILIPAGGGTPGGSNTNLQYNNNGAFGGFADGTSHQLLHGGRTFGAVDLTQEVSGLLPVANITSPILNIQDSSGALTGNSADQTVFSYTLPANTLPAGRGLRISVRYSQTGTTSTTYKLKFGATTLLSYTDTNANISEVTLDIYNKSGVTNAQRIASALALTNAFSALKALTITESSADTTSSTAILFTFNVANTVSVTPTSFVVQLL